MNVLSLVGQIWIPESPEYLYFYFKFREAKKAIRSIANFNKSKKLPVRY